MRDSMNSNSKLYQRIGKNICPIGENGTLNQLVILLTEYLYRLFDVWSKQTKREIKALKVHVYIQ